MRYGGSVGLSEPVSLLSMGYKWDICRSVLCWCTWRLPKSGPPRPLSAQAQALEQAEATGVAETETLTVRCFHHFRNTSFSCGTSYGYREIHLPRGETGATTVFTVFRAPVGGGLLPTVLDNRSRRNQSQHAFSPQMFHPRIDGFSVMRRPSSLCRRLMFSESVWLLKLRVAEEIHFSRDGSSFCKVYFAPPACNFSLSFCVPSS